MSLIQTPDNYLGYITNNSLTFITTSEMEAWKASKRLVVTQREINVYADAKEDDMKIVSDLLLGNIVTYKDGKCKIAIGKVDASKYDPLFTKSLKEMPDMYYNVGCNNIYLARYFFNIDTTDDSTGRRL